MRDNGSTSSVLRSALQPEVSRITGEMVEGPSVPSSPLYKAKRYAVKFDPPCIFLEYEDDLAKRRVRAVKLNHMDYGTDIDKLTRKVIRSFPRKLDTASVKYDQVRKLVVALIGQSHHHQASGAGSASSHKPHGLPSLTAGHQPHQDRSEPPTPLATESPSIIPGTSAFHGRNANASAESLERFSTSTAGFLHASTDGTAAPPGATSSQYDLDAALGELDKELTDDMSTSGRGSSLVHSPGGSTGNLQSPNLLSRDGSFSIADRTLSGTLATGPSRASGGSNPGTQQPQASRSRFAQEADKLVLDLEISGDVDLNKVSEVELKMAKMRMDEDFSKNQLKPGDPGFQYDKQVEFEPATQANDWDDSDDDEGGGDASSQGSPDSPVQIDWGELHAATKEKRLELNSETGSIGGSATPSPTKPATYGGDSSIEWP